MSKTPRTVTREWKWRRREVIIRDDYECQECGALGGRRGDTELDVHHIEHVENGGSDDPENLITLCADCHQAEHTAESTSASACPSPNSRPERDEETGQYVAEYSRESFKQAIRELGRDASTKAIADEVECEYDTAYKKLTRMENAGHVIGRKIASARLWEIEDDE